MIRRRGSGRGGGGRPGGSSVGQESEAMQRRVEIAPPGADELFAITRLADLAADDSLGGVVVGTAPTGHLPRLRRAPPAGAPARGPAGSLGGVVAPRAPPAHFLRLLDLPRTAGEWVREFMRLLL